MAKKPQIKHVRLDMKSPLARRRLARYLADGWEVLDSHQRGMFAFFPGATDYTLIRHDPQPGRPRP